MTDGLRKSHLRKAHQVGLSEVGLPEGNPKKNTTCIGFKFGQHVALLALVGATFISSKFGYQVVPFPLVINLSHQ